MRAHRDTKKKLYRRESVTSKGSIASGGEYRWGRHGKQADDEQLPLRESIHGRIQHGMDYTPLFQFLLSKVGQPWNEVHSEAVSRLDKPAPIFYLVALHRKNWRSYVCCGESSYYSGLTGNSCPSRKRTGKSLMRRSPGNNQVSRLTSVILVQIDCRSLPDFT